MKSEDDEKALRLLNKTYPATEPAFVQGSSEDAKARVLAGPDTPGKRFLIRLRKGKKETGGLQDMNKLDGMEKVKADVEVGKDEDDHWY